MEGGMSKKLLPGFCAALWNRAVGLPYHYRISAGHLEKDDPNDGRMWQLQSNGWHSIDK